MSVCFGVDFGVVVCSNWEQPPGPWEEVEGMFLPWELGRGEALPVWERIQSPDVGDGDGHGTGEVEGVEPAVTLPAIHWQTLGKTNKTVQLSAWLHNSIQHGVQRRDRVPKKR